MFGRMYTARSALAALTALALGLGSVANAADKLLPDKSEIVASVDLKALAGSELATKFDVEKHLRAYLKSQPQALEILTALNLDPIKDLHSITIGAAGLPAPGAGQQKLPDELLIIVHGNFDPDRIQAALAAHAGANSSKLSITEQGKFKIYEFKEKEPLFASLVDSKTIVASPKKECVVSALQKASGTLNSAAAGILGKINDKAAVWGILAITGSLKDAIKNNPQAAAAANLEGTSLTINVGGDIKLEILLHTTDAAAAKEMRSQVEAGFGFAKGFLQGNPDVPPVVGDLVNAIRFGEKGSSVSINLDISADALQKIVDSAKKEGGKNSGKNGK
jgi:hypothetical protein